LGSFQHADGGRQAKALGEGLRELGYVDGQSISVEYRFAEGKPERLGDLAADLVRLKPDVLFSSPEMTAKPVETHPG
jgi:putative ABC transport system substrate-binding protein